MDPNQSSSGSSGDPASHLQFQISLLRLMDQKSMDREMPEHKSMGVNAASKVRPAVRVPSVELMELERLQDPRRAKALLKTRS